MGILHMLILSLLAVPALQTNKMLFDAIENSLIELINITLSSEGRIPIVKGGTDYKVQWCNGPPGAIPLFLSAIDLFPLYRVELLKVAEMAGEVTWEQGLLLKGTGLCHGIAGNACVLHSLYRKFKELAD